MMTTLGLSAAMEAWASSARSAAAMRHHKVANTVVVSD